MSSLGTNTTSISACASMDFPHQNLKGFDAITRIPHTNIIPDNLSKSTKLKIQYHPAPFIIRN